MKRSSPIRYAGEGELHSLIREAGLSIDEFCGLAGISARTFHGWFGHPLQRTPIALLEHYIWARNMAAFLRERGWDPAKFKPKGLPPAPGGRYPRTSKESAGLIAHPRRIICPEHGDQEAMGTECPRC